jgi:hypothetical protein
VCGCCRSNKGTVIVHSCLTVKCIPQHIYILFFPPLRTPHANAGARLTKASLRSSTVIHLQVPSLPHSLADSSTPRRLDVSTEDRKIEFGRLRLDAYRLHATSSRHTNTSLKRNWITLAGPIPPSYTKIKDWPTPALRRGGWDLSPRWGAA